MEMNEMSDVKSSNRTVSRFPSPPTSTETSADSIQLDEEVDRLTGNLLRLYMLMSFDCRTIPLRDFIAAIERRAITLALEITNGHQRKASYLLGIKENVLCIKKQKYQLK